ncbi:MAG: Glu/Leu/Phe/Val family dehydrogenase [Planctomycetota bacterium]
MERTQVTHTSRSASSRIFEELGVVPAQGNLFHQSTRRLLDASELVGLRHTHQLILAQPKNEVMVQFPVQMDDGQHRLFKGYRVQHSNALGPYMGGVRYSPALGLDTVKGHAVLSTLRASLARVPFGGAFGGVKAGPGELSRSELMRVTRRFCSAISHQLGPEYDLVAPDMGTDAQVMAWFFDTLAQTTPESSRQNQSRAVLGKPAELGGFGPRARALATGVLAALDETAEDALVELGTARVSLVGFGHAGTAVAKALAARGARVVAVLSSGAALYEPGGIDVLALAQHRSATGAIDGFEGATSVLERDFWDAASEITVLCAGDGAMDARRAGLCRARMVVEAGGANITSDADDVLVRQGIEIVPDILACCGVDAAAMLEWREARQEPGFRKEDVDLHVSRQVTLAARRVRVARARYECDMRTAALCASLERIGKVYELRGVFP